VAFGAILLDDFLRYLENPAGFTTVTTSAAAAINLKPLTKGWVPFARSGRAPFTLSKAQFGFSYTRRVFFVCALGFVRPILNLAGTFGLLGTQPGI
jgi:hypothetical protein